MALQDILFHAEMSKYFLSLPEDVQEKLWQQQDSIRSSNDLYVQGESLLNNRFT